MLSWRISTSIYHYFYPGTAGYNQHCHNNSDCFNHSGKQVQDETATKDWVSITLNEFVFSNC